MNRVSVSFNYFGTYSTGDHLEIHDGNNITAPRLATLSSNAGYGTIMASSENTSGALTFKFVSDNYGNSGGWAAIVNTNAVPQNISMPGTYTLPSNSNAFFYDAGRPGGNYINNMNMVDTLSFPKTAVIE